MQNIFDSVVLIVVDSLPFMNRWSTYFANTPEIEKVRMCQHKYQRRSRTE